MWQLGQQTQQQLPVIDTVTVTAVQLALRLAEAGDLVND